MVRTFKGLFDSSRYWEAVDDLLNIIEERDVYKQAFEISYNKVKEAGYVPPNGPLGSSSSFGYCYPSVIKK